MTSLFLSAWNSWHVDQLHFALTLFQCRHFIELLDKVWDGFSFILDRVIASSVYLCENILCKW